MNRNEHVIIGAIVFVLYSVPVYIADGGIPDYFIYGFFASIIGSMLPDILEPARSWNHRGLFHSKRALKYVGIFSIVVCSIGYLSLVYTYFSIIYAFSGFCIGYLFHLLADSTTKMGLPN
jgi:membrane-bound metal-dependent hydrolase YbcI (DUF457 family)